MEIADKAVGTVDRTQSPEEHARRGGVSHLEITMEGPEMTDEKRTVRHHPLGKEIPGHPVVPVVPVPAAEVVYVEHTLLSGRKGPARPQQAHQVEMVSRRIEVRADLAHAHKPPELIAGPDGVADDCGGYHRLVADLRPRGGDTRRGLQIVERSGAVSLSDTDAGPAEVVHRPG